MYSISKFNSQLLSLIILMLPLGAIQNLSLSSSAFSISFFLVLLLCLLLYGTKVLFPLFLLIVLTATAYLLNADAFSIFPIARSLANIFYLLPITLVLFYPRRKVYISESRLKFLMLYLLFFTLFISLCCIYVALFYYPSRPLFPFDEPTRLGLFLISFGISYLIGTWPQRNSFKLRHLRGTFISAFIIASAILTLTSHFVSLLIAFLLFLVFILSPLYTGKKNNYKLLFILVLILSFLVASYPFLYSYLGESSKFSFLFDKATSNLSSLSWLSGYSQAFNSVLVSPFFGFGSGSFGYLNSSFSNDASDALLKLNGYVLNKYDGYSLFFKLVFEQGILQSILFVGLLLIRYLSSITNLLLFIHFHSNSFFSPHYRHLLQLYVFGLIILVASLVKEPTLTIFPGYFLATPLIISVVNPPSRSLT